MTAAEIIIASIGGSAAMLTAVGFLVKSLVTQLLTKDISLFKSNLEKVAYEHQVRFSQLHERRAEITAKLFASIVELEHRAKSFVSYAVSVDEKTNQEHLKQLWKAADEFKETFQKNRIYYSVEICDKLDELNNSLSAPISELVMYVEFNQNASDCKGLSDSWKKAKEQLDNKTPAIKREIELEFRKLLGVVQ